MDNRNALRIEVNGQICGKMILVENLEILDISMTGIRFNSMRRVNMDSPHRIKIAKNDLSLSLKGSIVRASFRGLREIEEKSMPVYEVAMHFEPLSLEEKKTLAELIGRLSHD